MRLRLGLALASVVGVALATTAALGGTARLDATETYRVVFQGSGRATSAYPPTPAGTVFTSTISWTLVYDVTLSPEAADSSWTPQSGSSITGGSDGVATASGYPIEPGCEHIGFSLDSSRQGAAYAGSRTQTTWRVALTVPGFSGGALLAYSPGQCTNPFPSGSGGSGCPNAEAVSSQTVELDASTAQKSWQLSARCDLQGQAQTESWSGTVTATRTAVSSGGGGSGSTGGCNLADIGLFAVSADAVDDAWAAGVCNEQGAVERWDGKAWTLVPLPPQSTSVWRLNGIAAVSPRDVWAVGTGQGRHGSETAIALHWDGARWTSVTGHIPRYIPSGGGVFSAVAATSAGAWLAGGVAGPRGLVARSNGSTLVATLDRATPKIAQSGFAGVAVASPRDVWLVGNSNERGGSALAEHWNGKSWREVRTPDEKSFELNGAAAAGGSVWAVGSGGYVGGAVERWNGAHWSIQVNTAAPLAAVAASSPTNVWAVGWSDRKGGLIEHWDGRSWSARPQGDLEFTGVATTSPDDAWAVAGPTILHWDGHNWTSVQSG
jgi:hypothetical protein